MPLSWVLFDLNGTLVDPGVMAHPLGDRPADEDLVHNALDDAVAQAMVATLTGSLTPFKDLLEAALRRRLRLEGRDGELAAQALGLMSTMPAVLEVPAALGVLRGEGLRLGVLTQSPVEAAEAVLRFAGLRDRLDVVLSAPDSGAYKPDPRPYRMALDHLGADAGEICLVAAHWWDVAGAKRAGLRTGWVARRERILLGTVPPPDYTGRDLAEVAGAIAAARQAG
jgi:2-haloacid dehalogenase